MTAAQLAYHVKRTLRRFGWRVERETSTGWQPGRTYWEPDYLRRWGALPRTLVDVGVGNGTPHLYAAFPDAYLLLVEPLAEEFGASIRSILARRAGAHVAVALGAGDAVREVRVEPRFAERSSFYARHALEVTGDAAAVRRVPVRTLDGVIAEQGVDGPFGVKIDVEGAELEVITGGAATLRDAEFVIAEVSVLDRFEGGHTFAEFVAAMDDLGFAARDVLGVGRADTSEVTFLDLVFRPRGATARAQPGRRVIQ
jgi:FkbM family methyltransferase